MKWFICQRKNYKNQQRSKALRVFLALVIVFSAFYGLLTTGGEVWAADKYDDKAPADCSGGWKYDEENQKLFCEGSDDSYTVKSVEDAPVCKSKWEEISVDTSAQNKHVFYCDDPRMTIQTESKTVPTYVQRGNNSDVKCYEVDTAAGSTKYCIGEGVGILHPGGEPTQDEIDDYKKGCYYKSGALGWLVCPVIEGIGGALSFMYENIITPFLSIEPTLITSNSDNGTFIAWNIFRTIANWVFVILFLVVIISQLTGIGIDNYGIKKILPKLIVVAILINLSYVICQLVVDLSNIAGVGLNSMFTGIASQINAEASSPAAYFDTLVSLVSGVLGLGVITAATVAVASMAVGQGWAVIGPILLGFVSAFLSVFFMFVILFVREALAVLLVAVAPLAFASYVLPNTKRLLFDKWLNLIKGVLLLYPLAGALIGGGLLASAIVVSASNSAVVNSDGSGLELLFINIGGIVLQVVPFFFLPTLFKNSINAVGNIGSAISGFGRNLRSGVDKTVKSSEGYQEWQARQAAGKPGGWRERIAQGTGLGKKSIARNRMKYDRLMSQQGAYDAMLSKDYQLDTETANETRRIMTSGEIDNSNKLEEGLRKALKSEDKAKIRAYTDALATKGSDGRDRIARAWDEAAESGEISSDAAGTFANNILNNHADFKASKGSLFELAKGINGEMSKDGKATKDSIMTTQQIFNNNDKRLALFNELTPASMGSITDGELDGIFGKKGDRKIPDGMDREKVIELIDAATSGENAANLSVGRRENLMDIKKDFMGPQILTTGPKTSK